MEYQVTWTIDVEAESPGEAAKQALEMQRAADSTATVFEVKDARGNVEQVDLELPEQPVDAQKVHALVPLDDGFIREVRVFRDHELAEKAKQEWLEKMDLTDPEKYEYAREWGTDIWIWECPVEE